MVSAEVPKKYLDRCNELKNLLKLIWSQPIFTFDELVPSKLETVGAVYIIGNKNTDEILYVGRTKDLRRRMYTNHLMGNESTARLKKYLTKDVLLKNFAAKSNITFPNVNYQKSAAYQLAKNFIKENCYFRFLDVDESRMRGLYEAGLTYVLDTRFVEEEH